MAKKLKVTTQEELEKKLNKYAKNGTHTGNLGQYTGPKAHASYENQQIRSGKASMQGAFQNNGYYMPSLARGIQNNDNEIINVALNLAKNSKNSTYNETQTTRSASLYNDKGVGFDFTVPQAGEKLRENRLNNIEAVTKRNSAAGPINKASSQNILNTVRSAVANDPKNINRTVSVGNNIIAKGGKDYSIVGQRKQQKEENRAVANDAMNKLDSITLDEIDKAIKENGGRVDYSVPMDMAYQSGNNEANSLKAGNVVANILKGKGFSDAEAEWYGQNWEQIKGIQKQEQYENKRSDELAKQPGNAYNIAKEYIAASKANPYPSDIDYQSGNVPEEVVDVKPEIFARLKAETGMSTDEALKYIQYVGEVEDEKNTEAMLKGIEKEINEHPVKAGIKYTAQDIASFPVAGIGAAMQSLEKKADPEAPINTNSDYYRLQNRADITKEAVTNNISNPVGRFAYGVGTSLGEMGSTLLVGGALVKSLGLTGTAAKIATEASTLTPFFGTSYASTLKSAQDKGFSDEQAVKYATVAGLAEVVFEKVGLDAMIDTFISASAGKLAGKELVKKLGLTSLAEGSEEVMTDIVNYIADEKVNGAFADSARSIVNYMSQGMTEAEARRKASNDFMLQLLESFGAGAASGLVMGAGAKVAGKVKYNSMAKTINANGNLSEVKQKLYDTAKNAPEGTTARTIVESKSLEDISEKDLADIIESETELAGTETDINTFVEEQVNETNLSSEEKKEAVKTILEGISTGSEDVTEEQEKKLTDTLEKDEKLQDVYAKAVTGQNTANTEAVVTAEEAVKSNKQKLADIKSGKTKGIAAVRTGDTNGIVTKVLNNGKVEVYDKKNGLQTKDISQVTFASQNAQQVINSLSRESTMSPEVSTKLASEYKISIPVNAFLEGVRTAYIEGASNTGTIESLINNGKNAFAAVVPQDTLNLAYALGKEYAKTAKAETVNAPATRVNGQLVNDEALEGKVDKRTQSISKMLAAITGNNVRYVDSIADGSEGYYDSDNREIVISLEHLNASGTVTATDILQVLGHEALGEYFEKVNPEGYDKVRKATIDLMEKVEGSTKTNATIKRIMDVYRSTVESGKTLEEASGELANNLISEIMFTEEGAKDLIDIANELGTEERQSFLQTIIDFLNDIINDIKSLFEGRKTGIAAVADVEELQKIRDMFKSEFAKGVQSDIENAQSAAESVNQMTESTGIQVDPETGTAIQHSVDTRLIETYDKLGYKYYDIADFDSKNDVKWEDLNQAKQNKLSKQIAIRDTAEKIAISLGAERPTNGSSESAKENWNNEVKKAMQWIEAENSLANMILSTEENRKFLLYDSDSRYSAIKKNSDYPQGTFDINNLCRKRDLFTKIFDAMQKEMPNRLYTAQDIANIRQAMWESNLEVACALCYVEDRRQQVGEIAQTYIDMYTSALKSKDHVIRKENYQGEIKPLVASKEQIKKYKLKGRAGDTTTVTDKEGNEKVVPAVYFYAEDNYIPNQYDLTTYKGFKELTENHPSIAYAFENYNNSRGMQAARLVEGRAEYNREILKWTKNAVNAKNRKGGLRMYSFSDFEAIHLIDTIQVIMDAAAKGVHIQAYTKVPAFAKLVSATGIKLNRSLIPATAKSTKAYAYVDGEFVKVQSDDDGIAVVNGKEYLAFDCIEGIDVTSPDFIDESKNNNIGNVIIGINEKQIKLAMESPFIDYIIPFHTGQTNKVLERKGINLWKNYKDFQEEKKLDGASSKDKGINIYNDLFYNDKYADRIKDVDSFVECFLEECERRHLQPRFNDMIQKDKNGKVTNARGYAKLLVDFKTFDTAGKIHLQENIRPEFKNGFMNQILMQDVERAKKMDVSDELVGLIKGKMQQVGTEVPANVSRSMSYNLEIFDENGRDKNGVKEVNISYDEMNENLHIVHNMKPVGTVAFNTAWEITNNVRYNARQIVEYIEKEGWVYVDSPEVGTVMMDMDGFVDVLYHRPKKTKFAIVDSIPYVLKYGKIVAADNNHKSRVKKNGKGYNTVTIVAPLTYTGNGYFDDQKPGEYFTAVTVRRKMHPDFVDQKMHVTDVETIKKEASDIAILVHKEPEANARPLDLRDILDHVSSDVNIFESDDTKKEYSIDYKIDEDALEMFLDDYAGDTSGLFLDEETEVGKVSKRAISIIEEGMKSAAKLNVEVDGKLVSKIAKKILKENNSKFDKDILENNLTNVFAYIKDRDGKVSYDDLMSVMDEIARPVLEQVVMNTGEGFEDRENIISYLKSQKIKLDNGQTQEVKNTYGSYNNFRMQQGLMSVWSKEGSYLDDIWEELCDVSGGYLDIATNPNDQPTELLATLESLKAKEVGVLQGESLDEAARDLSMDIFREFFELQSGENVQSNNTLRKAYTQAVLELNQAKAMLRKAYAADSAKAKAQAIEDASAVSRAESLESVIAAVDADLATAIGDGDFYLAHDLREQKKKYEERIKKLKSENAAVRKKLEETKIRNKNTRTQELHNRRDKELKKRIQKNMDYLNSLLKNETEKKHVPVQMVEEVIAICQLVQPEQTNSKLLQQKLEKLNSMYKAYQSDGTFMQTKTGMGGFNSDETSFIDYDKQLQEKMDKLIKLLNGRKYTQLYSPELQELLEITNAIRTTIRNANALIANQKVKDARDASKMTMEELKASANLTTAFGRKIEPYMMQHLNAYREFRKLSGYKDDSAVMSLWQELNDGEFKEEQVLREIDDIFNKVLDGKENQKNVKRLVSFKPKDMVDIGVKDEDGNPVLVTRGMRLSLIMHTYNQSNMNHLLGNGMVIPNMKDLEKGKISEAYGDHGTTYRLVEVGAYKKVLEIEDKNARAQALEALQNRAIAKLKTLEGELDQYERDYLAAAKEMFWMYTGKKINETSVRLNGYAKAKVDKYFPIKVDPDFIGQDFAGLIQDATIEGWGSLKARQQSKKEVYLEDITEVILRQAKNTARYVGYAIPVRDMNMIMNIAYYDENLTKHNVIKTLRQTWGTDNLQYLKDLMADIQGGRTASKHPILTKLRGNFAEATLNINAVVGAKQSASFPTAAAVLGWGPINRALLDIDKGFRKKEGLKELEKINPLLWYRNQGNSTEELGDIRQKKGFGQKINSISALNWIQNMDTGTVRTLEYASMYYVDEQMEKGTKGYENITKGSKYYWQKVSEIFTKTVHETQPNYSVMERAAIQRDPDSLIKNIMMFKTQPLQNFGIMYDAIGELNAKLKQNKDLNTEQTKAELNEAWNKFARATSSQFVAALVYSIMDIFGKAILLNRLWKYKDEDDKDQDGRTDDILWSELLKEVFVKGIPSTLIGGFIGGSELYEAAKSIATKSTYYGMEVSIIGVLNGFIESIQKVQQYSDKLAAAETTADKEKFTRKRNAAVLSLAGYTAQFLGAPFNNVKNYADSIYRYAEGIVTGKPLADMGPEENVSQRQMIMQALINGDMAEYNRLLEETRNDKGNVMNISKDVKEAYLNGEISEDKAKDWIIDNMSSVEDETGANLKLEEWEWKSEHPDETYDANAKTEDLQKYLGNKDFDSAKTEIKALQDKGLSDDTIKKGIKNACFDEYQKLKKASKSANYVNSLAKLMAQAGLYKDVKTATEAIKNNWLTEEEKAKKEAEKEKKNKSKKK